MMYRVFLVLIVGILSLTSRGFSATEEAKPMEKHKNPIVILKTSEGYIKLELYQDQAPATVSNFLRYVNDGSYNDTIFHRVIPGFMIQGGGFTVDFKQKPTGAPIKNEADNGLKNLKGTIAMARTSDPNSATSQFFINTADNAFLDFKNASPSGWGYAVFGKVISGMDVVEKIQKAKTGNYEAHRDVPINPIIIENAVEVKE